MLPLTWEKKCFHRAENLVNKPFTALRKSCNLFRWAGTTNTFIFLLKVCWHLWLRPNLAQSYAARVTVTSHSQEERYLTVAKLWEQEKDNRNMEKDVQKWVIWYLQSQTMHSQLLQEEFSVLPPNAQPVPCHHREAKVESVVGFSKALVGPVVLLTLPLRLLCTPVWYNLYRWEFPWFQYIIF